MSTLFKIRQAIFHFFSNLPGQSWVIPFLSIFTALVLYIYVNGQKRVEKQANIPLEVIGRSDKLTFSTELPKVITVYFSGSKGRIADIDFNSLYAEIDISSMDESGAKLFAPKLIGEIPGTVKLLRIYPNRIPIVLSKTYEKWVKIEPLFIHQDKNEYEIRGYKVRPGSTLITGPRSIVEDIVSLSTEPIDVGKITENTQIEVQINKNTSSFIDFNRNRPYRVSIDVGSKEQSIRVEGPLQVEARGLNASLELDEAVKLWVDYMDVVVPSDQAEELYLERNVVFYTDLSQIKEPGLVELNIQFDAPSFIQVEDYEPKIVAIEIQSTEVSSPIPIKQSEPTRLTNQPTNSTETLTE